MCGPSSHTHTPRPRFGVQRTSPQGERSNSLEVCAMHGKGNQECWVHRERGGACVGGRKARPPGHPHQERQGVHQTQGQRVERRRDGATVLMALVRTWTVCGGCAGKKDWKARPGHIHRGCLSF